MKHVLAISTIYPNPVQPRAGVFVERSMEALANRPIGPASKGEPWRVTVINPIGMPPIPFGRYKPLTDLPLREERAGIAVHRPRFPLIPRFGARLNAAAIARAVLPLARAIHSETPIDVIDAQYFFPDGPAAAIVSRSMNRPLSIKARGSDINYWGKRTFARRQMLEAASNAEGLLAVSDALRAAMIALGMPGEKIGLHYTGLDRDLFRPMRHDRLRSQLGTRLGIALPRNGPLFACVGTLNRAKGHDIAIRALARLRGEHSDAQLLLVGKGPEEAALQALSHEMGLADRVHLTGAIDHRLLPLILSAADAMVLPSQSEGLANAWVEAIACGTPVITTDVGGARELVTDRAAGRLVERDPQSFAEGMREVLSDPRAPEDVARAAERFDWRIHARELAAHYERLVRPLAS